MTKHRQRMATKTDIGMTWSLAIFSVNSEIDIAQICISRRKNRAEDDRLREERGRGERPRGREGDQCVGACTCGG